MSQVLFFRMVLMGSICEGSDLCLRTEHSDAYLKQTSVTLIPFDNVISEKEIYLHENISVRNVGT